MTSFDLVVRFKCWQYVLNISIGEKFNEIKSRIESKCGIAVNKEEYVLEVYNADFNQYIVFTERYLTELYKSLLTTPIQRLKARITSRHFEDIPPQGSARSRNYLIVWLDEYIGKPYDYQMLKNKFNSTLDLNVSSYLPTDELLDIDNLASCERERLYEALHIFNSGDKCLKFVQKNAASSAIFFITSSSLARFIIPFVVGQVRAIYVLRSDLNTNAWMFHYLNYSSCILIFDHDTDVLVRVARDVADYCIEQSKKWLSPRHLSQALYSLFDAEELLIRANIIDGDNVYERLNDIYQQIQQLTDVTSNEYDHPKPNHLILWLDENIGVPAKYRHLKKAFASNRDLRNQTGAILTDTNYDNLLRARDTVPVTFNGVYFLLQTFDNIDACLAAFERHQDKRIFFITSESMGQDIVPQLIDRYRHVFTDPVTNEPYTSIYVFCHDNTLGIDWGVEYFGYINMFRLDSDLLQRMTHDIADYFISQSKQFQLNNDSKNALQRLNWAKKLWYQYDKMQQTTIPTNKLQTSMENNTIEEINKLMAQTTAILPYTHQSDDTSYDNMDARHRLLHSDFSFGIASINYIQASSEEFTTNNRLFIRYQLLMEILLRIPYTEESRKDFIDWSCEHYSGSTADKNAIGLFASTYNSGQVIAWYTKQSFFYSILSRTFTTNDIRLIFKIRYIICDLYRELKKLHEETFAILNPQICVYRGKKISLDELRDLKASKGKLLITKSFLSASLDKDVAVFYFGDKEVRAGSAGVIFRMIIDKGSNNSRPFAFVGERSTIQDEAEFIIPPGMIFQNRDINKIEENMFEVTLVHSREQDILQENLFRSKAYYLQRAQNIESIDDFDSLITEASNPLNEQEIPQPSRAQDNESDCPLIEPRSTPLIQQRTTNQKNGHPLQIGSSSRRISLPASNRLRRELNQLQISSICTGKSAIFTIDRTPFDEEEDTGSSESYSIVGRLFPRSNLYNQGAYMIKLRFPPSYPFVPPEVCFITHIYHPNVDHDGKVCLDILDHCGGWSMTLTVISVIEAVVDCIDFPDINTAMRFDVAQEYMNNRVEFESKAVYMVKKYGLSRN